MDFPEYTFSELPPWSCTMTFPSVCPLSFGHGSASFAKKETAKKAAAMEAVKSLRASGKLTVTTSKRRKSSTLQADPETLPTAPESPTSSLLQALDEKTAGESPAEQVYHLASKLGFSQPQYHLVRRDANFVDESASFSEKDVRYEPKLAGRHGKVERVFGKKTAHEECCRLVLLFLKEIEQSRMGLIPGRQDT